MKIATLVIQALVSLAFIAAGGAKLIGQDMMVQTFEAIGWGQWFRYVTGIIELAAGIGLWLKGLQMISALALVCTMIGAVAAHLLVLGPSAVPALVLGLLSAFLAWRFSQNNA